MPTQAILGSIFTDFLNISLEFLRHVMLNLLSLNLIKFIKSKVLYMFLRAYIFKQKKFTQNLSHRQKKPFHIVLNAKLQVKLTIMLK